VGQVHDETAAEPTGAGRWQARLSPAWSISGTPNGGYAALALLRAMSGMTDHADPVSVTIHYLRPAVGGGVADLAADVVRRGRSTAVVRGRLTQAGEDRLVATAVFADLSAPAGGGPELSLSAPPIPPPDACTPRAQLVQGVELAILDRVDVRVHVDGSAGRAIVDGWARLVDGTAPDALTLVLLSDVFPPSAIAVAGPTGWVPTIELTVHVRRRPVPGWIQGRFETDDLHGGRMIESGCLWDESGALVARSRQLGLLRS
jgi:acyl-CoA thioesterase